MDVNNRDEYESELAKKLAKLLSTQMGRLLELMGDPPDINNVPSSFWDEAGVEFTEIIRPFLERLFLDQAGMMMESQPIGIEWTLINERAAEWASTYSFDLVRGITGTSRQRLQDAVSRYFRDGQTIGELEESLSSSFGPVRAEMIAVTEVTRAAARGEDALVNELAAQGIQMVTTWSTNADELVCPRCGPLNGKVAAGRSNGEPYWIHPTNGAEVRIPAHVRCRCWENNELPEV